MVVIGSDSGKISILEYVSASNSWKLLHCEVFGKTGCRRIVPGQYVATDPKGRAILIGKFFNPISSNFNFPSLISFYKFARIFCENETC